MLWRTRGAVVLLLLILSVSALAEAPGLISYQGRLTDAEGEPFSDGTYVVTFSVYSVAVGGIPIWTEAHSTVYLNDGLFSVMLGSIQPLDDEVFAGTERFLEVEVEGGIVLPRTQVTSGAYALRIGTVDGARGGTITDELVITESGVFTPGDPGFAAADAGARFEVRFSDSRPVVSIWDPVDSKIQGFAAATKKLEIRHDGLYMFGATESDTNLSVTPDGDIIGVGQITMGENSSQGLETSVLGFRNTAEGDSSAIGGGSNNQTTGTISVIGGGHSNVANGEGATISGGAFQTNDGLYATISGGQFNTATGAFSVIPGGRENAAFGDYSFALGHRAQSLHNGSFVWADQTDADFASTGEDQFIVRATGGVGINTDSPVGQLSVGGSGGDQSVNLPEDAIASPEILDEPGLSSEQSANTVTLTQGAVTVVQVSSTSITIPTAGYVVVRGLATMEATGTSKRNQAYLQIDDMPGGGIVSPYFTMAGNGDHDTPSTTHYLSMSTERVFYKEAGTHTFYLEGLAHEQNKPDAVTRLARPSITALFIPTAYGAVSQPAAPQAIR